MTNFYFNHDPANLPDFSEDCHPVQMFHTHQNDITKHSLVSKQLLQTVRDLGLHVDADAIDLITIATAVTAADTFELRDLCAQNEMLPDKSVSSTQSCFTAWVHADHCEHLVSPSIPQRMH